MVISRQPSPSHHHLQNPFWKCVKSRHLPMMCDHDRQFIHNINTTSNLLLIINVFFSIVIEVDHCHQFIKLNYSSIEWNALATEYNSKKKKKNIPMYPQNETGHVKLFFCIFHKRNITISNFISVALRLYLQKICNIQILQVVHKILFCQYF